MSNMTLTRRKALGGSACKFMMTMNRWACFATADNYRNNVIDRNKKKIR